MMSKMSFLNFNDSSTTYSMCSVFMGCIFTFVVNWWSMFHYISYVKGADRFVRHYDDSKEKFALFFSIALGAGYSLKYLKNPWFQGMMTYVISEIFMSIVSLGVAYVRGRRRGHVRPLKKKDIERVTHDPKSKCRPPQIIRWDIAGVALSGLFGKLASIPLPRCLRGPYFRLYARRTGANLEEIEGDLESFPSLRAFFTRKLRPGSRPISRNDFVSPVDGKVVVFGKVTSDRIEQIKGATYSRIDFLGEDDPLNTTKKSVFHIVIYLNPGDYHRLHSPCKFAIHGLRHFPGTLFPISPLLSRLVPDLFSLNERVVLQGSWKHGAMSYVAVGAYNVGTMSFHFDETIRTNRLIRDWRNPNLNALRLRKDLGDYAYQRFYDPSILVNKASEIGTFNLGSTVVLLFEAPESFEFDVKVHQQVKLGQSLGRVVSEKKNRKKVKKSPSSRSSSSRRRRRHRSKTPVRRKKGGV